MKKRVLFLCMANSARVSAIAGEIRTAFRRVRDEIRLVLEASLLEKTGIRYPEPVENLKP